MGTIVFSAVGNAILPGAGYYIGAALGAVVDNAILFRPPDQVGPRLDDLQLGSGAEGQPIWDIYGQENRTPGQVIWMSELKETKHRSSNKGGPKSTSYTYSVDLAVAIGEGELANIDKIICDGSVLWDGSPNISVSSNLLSVVKKQVFYNWGIPPELRDVYQDITSPNGGPDLSDFRSGELVTVSGFSNANNNGTFRVVSATKNDTTGVSVLRVRNFNVVAQGAGSSVTLLQTLPNFSPNAATAFTFYMGTPDQLPDPLIQSYVGNTEVPGYTNLAYVVINNLQLENYGNRVPQFQFLASKTAAPQTLDSVVSQIMTTRGGRLTEEFDTSALSSVIVKGYTIRGVMATEKALGPLILTYSILTQDRNGVVHFMLRSDPPTVTLTEDQLGWSGEGDGNAPQKILLDSTFVGQLPYQCTVDYVDPASNYQTGSTIYTRPDLNPLAKGVIAVDTLITMTATEANALARRLTMTELANKWKAKFNLPPSCLHVLENDVVKVTHKGLPFEFLVDQLDDGANCLRQVESYSEETETQTQTGVADNPGAIVGGEGTLFYPPDTWLSLLQLGPIRADDVYRSGFYWVGCYADPSEPFFGADFFQSIDFGVTYDFAQHLPIEAIMGSASTALAATGVKVGLIDYRNTVTVVLNDPDVDLSSCTMLEMLNGKNRGMLGSECIGWITATLSAPNTYILSGLLRGQVDTQDAVTGHVIGDTFLVLDTNTIQLRELQISTFNTEMSFKLLAQGGVLSNYVAQTVDIDHPLLRHFAPCHLAASRNVSNDIKVRWKRRARCPFRLLGGTGVPLDDDIEQYHLEIWNVAETVVLFTAIVDNATEYDYLAASQTGHGLTAGAALHIRVYQISSIVGRSYAAKATV